MSRFSMAKERLQLLFNRTGIKKVWVFPLLILAVITILTCLKISGTSVGMYHEKLYGDAKDASLILNQPRAIRSDEWGVNTPYVVSQVQQGFPVTNIAPGNGQDIALTFDAPVGDWSLLFKPQNLPFYVLPLENAFALKWWLLAAFVLLATYAFILTLLPRRYLLASLISIGFFLSPFIHWWYQSGTILPIAYGLLIAAVAISIIKANWKTQRLKLTRYMGALMYLFTCYAFLLYVPFILPIALVIGVFLLGYFLNYQRNARLSWREVWKKLALIGLPLLAALCLAILYVKSHAVVLEALSQSVYPGQRTVSAGGYTLQQLFGGYFNMQLQEDAKAVHYELNQSEASGFMLLFPLLTPFFIYHWRKTKQIDWRVILLGGLFTLFCLYLFVPFTEPLFNLLQLTRVPHNRLLIGIGVLNLLLIAVAVEQLATYKKALPSKLAIASSLLSFVVALSIGLLFKITYDGYLESLPKILAISAVVAVVVWLLLQRYLKTAFALLAIFSFVSVMAINPLYQGLGILTNSPLISSIKELGSHHDNKWVVDDSVAFLETLPAVAGAGSLSGVYAYPQLNVWKSLGTDADTKAVYNRYAHVFFSIETINKPDATQGAYLNPPALDAFKVTADPCSTFLKEQNVRYILTGKDIVSECAQKISEIPYPLTMLSIYKLTN